MLAFTKRSTWPWRRGGTSPELSRGWFGTIRSARSFTCRSRSASQPRASSFLRVTERYEKPKWNIAEAVPEVADAKPFCNLVRFRRKQRSPARCSCGAAFRSPCDAAARHRAIAPADEVWITDWVNARLVPLTAGPFHLADYVDYVRYWIKLLSPDLRISVCQPTVPVWRQYRWAANGGAIPDHGHDGRADRRPAQPYRGQHPRAPQAVLLVRAPPDRARSVQVPGLHAACLSRIPAAPGLRGHEPDRHLIEHWDYYHKLVMGDGESAEAHRRFYDEYNAVLDMPAEYYLDTVKTVFQDYALPKGRMFVREELVRPQAIRDTALLTIEGLDDISGNGQTEAAHALCLNIPRAREHFVAPGVGHYGIFSGRRWREVIYPRVRDFIREHSEKSGSKPDSPERAKYRKSGSDPIFAAWPHTS